MKQKETFINGEGSYQSTSNRWGVVQQFSLLHLTGERVAYSKKKREELFCLKKWYQHWKNNGKLFRFTKKNNTLQLEVCQRFYYPIKNLSDAKAMKDNKYRHHVWNN